MNLSVKKVEANRNFANKVWNAGRYVIGALPQAPQKAESAPQWTLADRWIHARLGALVRDVERLFENYQYGEAGRQIYDFFWAEFADWYVEISKRQLAEGGDRAYYTAQTLVRTLDACLRLLHPFTPFVTEAVWGYLKEAVIEHGSAFDPAGGWEQALIQAKWPEPQPGGEDDESVVAAFSLVMDIVRTIRNTRTEKKLAPGKRIPALIVAGERTATLQDQATTLASLAGLDPDALKIFSTVAEKPAGQAAIVVSGVEIYLQLADEIDTAAEQARLEKELADTESQIQRLETLLGSPFAQKAPAAVVEKERQKLAAYLDTAGKLREQIKSLA
jgi:valyl-tRNA synthetase